MQVHSESHPDNDGRAAHQRLSPLTPEMLLFCQKHPVSRPAITKTRITFVLPGAARFPVGGFKVIYEYANRLSAKGHQVSVVHPASARIDATGTEIARSAVIYVCRKLARSWQPHWFPMKPAVRSLYLPSLSARHIPDADVVIATAWQTAEWVAGYPRSKGEKFYLIQQLETWHGLEERVIATWRLPLRKLVIAQWLLDFARGIGEVAELQPNGLDFERFFLTKDLSDRNPSSVMMLYHQATDKGSADGLQALSLVRKEIPDLRVTLFGTSEKPSNLDPSFQYHRCPPQEVLRNLYNESAVFIAPSWTEGWALPPAEAMMCGAALAATDIGGHRGYAIADQTALLSPPRKPEMLAANVLRLVKDSALRTRIAAAGHEFIRQFTWDRSVDKLEHALLAGIEDGATKVVAHD